MLLLPHPNPHYQSMIGIAEIFLITAACALTVQLFYYVFFYLRLAAKRKNDPKDPPLPPLSVIICARSESTNLVQNLPYIFSQNYPSFEVVVVNDRSWDDTKDILKAFSVKHENLHVININESGHGYTGKKMALTLGIKGAKNEVLVFTDADCKPVSENWLRQMAGGIDEKTEIVLGYSPYEKRKGFLNKLIRYDTFMGGANFLSFAHSGIPYMGVGRNLCYRKSLFFRVSGFKKHYHIASGDDDLFVNQAASRKNTAIQISPDSHVLSFPKENYSEWVRQKKRHFTTAPHYRFIHKFLLALWPASFWLLLGATAGMLFLNKYLLIILIIWVFRLLLQILIFRRIMKSLGDRDLLPWLPVLELMILVIHPVIFVSNRFVKSDKWN